MIPPPPLSLSLAGLERRSGAPWSAGPRAAIEWAASEGFRFVQLDGTQPGLRARELDRSARRDLAALLRRVGLGCTGLDLLIPPADLADPERAERATSALRSAMELTADLRALGSGAPAAHVCVALDKRTAPEHLTRLREHASTLGVPIADVSWPLRGVEPGDPIGVTVDPAAALLAGGDPSAAVSRAGPAMVAARLSDADSAARASPGGRGGRLDRLAYTVALATAGVTAPVVLDMRGLAGQERVAPAAKRWWEGADDPLS